MDINSQEEAATKWSVDPIHSELAFRTRHIMITTVTGRINNFELEVQTTGSDFGNVISLQLKACLDSLSTGHGPRDKHLMSQDFLDARKFPYLEFQGINFEKGGMPPPSFLGSLRRDFKIQGLLSIKGLSRRVNLNGEFGGLATDLVGDVRAGFTVRGRISRKDFGLDWAGVLRSGKLIVSDEVDIVGNIQLIKQAPAIKII